MPVKIRCSNCLMEFYPGIPTDDAQGPYGICQKCEKLFKQQQEKDLKEFIESLRFPTLVVNQDLRVVAYNESCWRDFCSGLPKPIGLLTGEFLGCQNALLLERCGGSAFCFDCTIRRTAVETLKTGQPQKNIRATLNQLDEGRRLRNELLVSTEKLGDLVKISVNSFFTVLEPPSQES